MNKNNSPYIAALTGGGFLYHETNMLLPLLQSDKRKELIRDEAMNNKILHINAETSRKRNISEIERRFDTMPASFWIDYQSMDENQQIVALFLVILKTYKICFDFHVNVTMKKWNSISKSVSHDDIMMEFNEIAAKDEFVDSWSEWTRKKITGAYLTILRKVGILDRNENLRCIECTNFDYYITHGEAWFLEACLIPPYQIENIKRSVL